MKLKNVCWTKPGRVRDAAKGTNGRFRRPSDFISECKYRLIEEQPTKAVILERLNIISITFTLFLLQHSFLLVDFWNSFFFFLFKAKVACNYSYVIFMNNQLFQSHNNLGSRASSNLYGVLNKIWFGGPPPPPIILTTIVCWSFAHL